METQGFFSPKDSFVYPAGLEERLSQVGYPRVVIGLKLNRPAVMPDGLVEPPQGLQEIANVIVTVRIWL